MVGDKMTWEMLFADHIKKTPSREFFVYSLER